MSAAAANPDSSIRWSKRLLSQSPRGVTGDRWIATCPCPAFGVLGHRIAPRSRLRLLDHTRTVPAVVTLASLRVVWTGRSQTAPGTAQPDRHELAQVFENTPLTAPEGGVVHRFDRRTQRMFDKSQAGVTRIAGPADLMIIRVPSAVSVGAFE